MKSLLHVLKDNTALRFAFITGCLKIAKESIFTGTNNFVSDTIAVSRFNEYFGFVQSELDELLEDAALQKYAESMKAWYGGYHFGDFLPVNMDWIIVYTSIIDSKYLKGD